MRIKEKHEMEARGRGGMRQMKKKISLKKTIS
jgi:hypothetical protein